MIKWIKRFFIKDDFFTNGGKRTFTFDEKSLHVIEKCGNKIVKIHKCIHKIKDGSRVKRFNLITFILAPYYSYVRKQGLKAREKRFLEAKTKKA